VVLHGTKEWDRLATGPNELRSPSFQSADSAPRQPSTSGSPGLFALVEPCEVNEFDVGACREESAQSFQTGEIGQASRLPALWRGDRILRRT